MLTLLTFWRNIAINPLRQVV